MKHLIPLRTRIFLLAAGNVFLVAGVGFAALNPALRGTIKERLKESFQSSGAQLSAIAGRFRSRSAQTLSVLSDNAGLKAAISLIREVPAGSEGAAVVRRTIEANLLDLARGLEYQLMLVTDADGRPVAGTVQRGGEIVPLDPLPSQFQPESLIEVQGVLYETITNPINVDSENLGSLTAANEFSIAGASPSGIAVLLDDQQVIQSTFAWRLQSEVETRLREECLDPATGCEILINGENFLALPLERPNWKPGVKLYGFQSLDGAVNDFTRDFEKIFLWVGIVALLSTVLFASYGARSVSKPITDLIVRLQSTERAGRLAVDFPTNSAIDEINLLASTLNQAGVALDASQGQLARSSQEFLETMARALDARDPYTAGHSDRVSANSTAIAEAMGLPKREVEIIRIGAKMHDIGKIGVPDAVLQKPGALTRDELAQIQLHPQIGKRILEKVEAFHDYLPIVELHHENFDGSGYPYGLRGDQVPLGVRIVHVADVYDAITSNRAYRAAMPRDMVLQIMRGGSGTLFDPAVVDCFLEFLRRSETLDRLLTEVQTPQCSEQAMLS